MPKLTKLFLDWTSGTPLIDDDNIVWVSMSGLDVNNGTVALPVLTITKAMTLVNATRNKVIVLPGTYEEAAAITWPLFTQVQLIGIGTVEISIAAGTTVINVAPGVVASTFEMTLENFVLDHGDDAGITLTNTAMTKKLNCYVKNVSSDGDGNTLATVHGDTSNAIRVYWDGDKGNGIEGPIAYNGDNDGDRLYFDQCNIDGGIVTNNQATALAIRLVRCRLKHEGITGGNASQTVLLVATYSESSGTWAIADTDDVQGDQTTTIVVNA